MANKGTTFFALLTGAAIGAGLGMLYAPESGENTRRKLGENARRTQDNLNKQYKETSSSLSQKARKAKLDFESKLEDTLSSASTKADEILEGLETKLEELRRQNAKFQKKNESGFDDKSDDRKEKVTTPNSINPSTDNSIA